MPPRRRSLASSEDAAAVSSETSSPPPAKPAANKKRGPAPKKAKIIRDASLTADSSIDTIVDRPRAPSRAKSPPKKKRQRQEDVEEALAPAKTKAASKNGVKRAKADATNGKSGHSPETARHLASSDSEDFIFTTEAYRPPPGGTATQPGTKRQANGKSSAAVKSAAQPLPPRTTDVKGKRRVDESSSSSARSKQPSKSAARGRQDMPPPPAPGQPTTPRGKTRLDPILHAADDASRHDTTVKLAVADTPMQNRNIAMRKAADAAQPSSSRRTSFERRGRRSSFVGDGFEALPHPTVDNALLHRHINPNELPSMRFLTLASWAAQRQAKEMAEAGPSTSASDIRARDLATKVANAFVANIARQAIDLHWSEHAEAESSQPSRRLLPNEANERNRAKRDALEGWIQRMNAEQTARSEVKPRYAALQAPRQASASLISVNIEDVDLKTPLPDLRTADDIIAYGRSLLQSAKTHAGQTPAKEKVNVEEELNMSFEELRLQAASLRQQTHRIEQFARLGQGYADSRIAAVHRALDDAALGGPPLPEAADLLRALTRAELPPPHP